MYKFAKVYRRSFGYLLVTQVILSLLLFLFQKAEGLILIVLALISFVHFIGLVAVVFDTNRCARNNSVYLKNLTELLSPDETVQKVEEPVGEPTEELVETEKPDSL